MGHKNIVNTSIISIDKKNITDLEKFGIETQTHRINIIRDLINMMGFDLNNIGGVKLARDVFIKNMNMCVKNKIFSDKECKKLFGIKPNEIKNVKAFMGFVNSIIKNWGLCVNIIRKKIYIKKQKKCNNEYEYSLNYYQNINNYI